jgi:hypothetical protein
MIDAGQLISRRRTMTRAIAEEWQKTTVLVRWHHGFALPVGTEYKQFETTNFGWVILRHPGPDGRKIWKE